MACNAVLPTLLARVGHTTAAGPCTHLACSSPQPHTAHVLTAQEGKVVSQSSARGVAVEGLGGGSELVLGSFEIEIDSVLDAHKFQ